MKALAHVTAATLLALAMPTGFAQQTGSSTSSQAAQTPSPAEFDKKLEEMQQQMAKMHEQMSRIQQTQDPEARQRLLQEHWTAMQSMMTKMHSAWGGMMGSCCGAGGHMMGDAMGGRMMGPMWSDYRNLTPEQLRQRQYMMDRWMPMQQMMMDQMMQHQYWMMHTPRSSSTPNK